MLLSNVRIEPMRYLRNTVVSVELFYAIIPTYLIKVILAYATNEAVGLHVLLDRFQLITKLTESVNDQTLDDGKQDNNDEEEERNVE